MKDSVGYYVGMGIGAVISITSLFTGAGWQVMGLGIAILVGSIAGFVYSKK